MKKGKFGVGRSVVLWNLFAWQGIIRYHEKKDRGFPQRQLIRLPGWDCREKGGEMGLNHRDERATHEIYWESMVKVDPNEVCRRTGATYSQDRKGYFLPILNKKYFILPEEKRIFCVKGDLCEEEALRDYFFLMVLLYLLNGQEEDPTHTWVSEKEIKGGTTFFRGPHSLQTEELKETFGRDPDGFLHAGKQLGGVELLFGDKAFALTVFPRVPLAYLLWKESQEFPAQVNVLFDSTIQKHFSLDGIWCVVAEVSQRLLEVRQR
jgi:hypothetical protein